VRGNVAKRINELVPGLPKSFKYDSNTPCARRMKKRIWNKIPRPMRGKIRMAELGDRWGMINAILRGAF
jgi:hypothetical protein